MAKKKLEIDPGKLRAWEDRSEALLPELDKLEREFEEKCKKLPLELRGVVKFAIILIERLKYRWTGKMNIDHHNSYEERFLYSLDEAVREFKKLESLLEPFLKED